MSEYNICYSLDSNYAEQSAVSITSIIKNTDVNDIVNFYILDGGLTDKDKSDIELLKNIKNFNIKYITINPDDFSSCPMLKDKDNHYSDYHVTLPTYFRFKSASIFNKLNKILYLDCDVIVRKPLKELFDINMEKYAVSMVLDAEYKKEAKRLGLKKYYNAGVMLINLDFWRKNNIEDKLFDFALKNKDIILWQDQDVINCVLADNIKNLDDRWNYQYFLYEKIDIKKLTDCVILHLSGRFKPWLIHFEHPVYDEYYYYLSCTPWRNKVLEYKQLCTGRFLKDNIGGRSTNILLNATKEDLYSEIKKSFNFTDELKKDLYQEVEKSYKYTDKNINDLKKTFKIESDGKLNKIYNEITKNYKYIDESLIKLNTDLITKFDEKLKSVFDEISKNYEYIDKTVLETKEVLKIDTDEKIKGVYDEVSKNYKYIDKTVSEAKEILKIDTDKKIKGVYDEVSKNYEYIEKTVSEAKETLKIDTDEKIKGVYDEVSKNYEYIDKTAEKTEYEITRDFNEKLNLIYEELSKNYKYTDKAIFDASIHERDKRDEKVNACFEEITNNYKYTEKLFEQAKNDFLKKISDKSNEINQYINTLNEELKLKIENADIKTKDFIEKDYKNAITNEVNGLNYQIDNIEKKSQQLKSEIINEYKNKIRELYSYINEQSLKIINDSAKNNQYNQDNLENKITAVNSYINFVENNLKNIEQNIDNKAEKSEINNFNDEINKRISDIERFYQNKINEIESSFENKLNNQRMQYEEKLFALEKRLENIDKIFEEKNKGIIYRLKTKSPRREIEK